MSSVTIPSGGYYPLASQQQSDLLGSGSGTSASDPMQSLLDALNSTTDNGNSSSGNNSYMLDLSPAAQQLLSGGSTGSQTTATNNTSFTLTTAQQNTIKSIVAKYADAPQDQATFDQIQNDLAAAGLSPQQLAAQDQVNSFNATATLVDALNGNYTDPGSQNINQSSTEQTKISNYLQGIITLWQNSASSASSTGTASS